jgi:hypothetical protein
LDRRKLLKTFGKSGLLATLSVTTKASGNSDSRSFLFYSGQKSQAENFLKKVGSRVVISDVRFVNVETDPQVFEKIKSIYGPNTTAISFPILVAVPSLLDFHGEVEVWNNEWVTYAENLENDDAIVDACYPISGGWWSVEGDWNPTEAKVRWHLFESPNHSDAEFKEEWLKLLTRPELQSIHSDHHREMINQGEVHWNHVNSECPKDPER